MHRARHDDHDEAGEQGTVAREQSRQRVSSPSRFLGQRTADKEEKWKIDQEGKRQGIPGRELDGGGHRPTEQDELLIIVQIMLATQARSAR